MITPQTDKKYTMVHAFSGSGGCSSGFDEEGFETLAALDFDADACADLDYLLKPQGRGRGRHREDGARRHAAGRRRPPAGRVRRHASVQGLESPASARAGALSDKYVRMCSLAVRSVWLALHAWDEPPPLIVIENVRGMSTEGREMMDIIKRELRAFGYLFDIRTWNVGKIGNLAQSRDRCLFVARNPKRCPAFLMVPTEHPLRPCGDELGRLPPPTLDKASKSMHKLPQLSAMNWLRIAAIPPGKDWKALPARIQLGGNPKDRADPRMNLGPNAHAGIMGVEHPGRPAHTVTGNARMQGTWGGVADPFLARVDRHRLGDGARGLPDLHVAADRRRRRGGVDSRASVAHPGYPEPTHWLVRDEAGGLVLLGPEITDWDEICYLVIMTEDEPGVWSWHRPMTDLELAVLQSLPAEHNGAMLALRGPSGKRREHIGNMLPKAVAKAIARACRATLDQPHATFQLVGKGQDLGPPEARASAGTCGGPGVNRIERAAFACAWSGVRFAWYGARGQQPPADHGVRLETRPPVLAAWRRCRRAHGLATPS
jgi:site-specific DNA-cytosine methylase